MDLAGLRTNSESECVTSLFLRYYGRKILYTVCDHHEFDKLVSKHLPDNLQKTVRDTVENLRTKVSRFT